MMTDSTKTLLQTAREAFISIYSATPKFAACAPGRVNLIGEHTDYNDGFVLPLALPQVTVAVGAPNSSQEIRLTTLSSDVDEPHSVTFPVKPEPGVPSWANYMKGVIAHYPGKVSGFDMVLATTVPVGGGLSSSAASEVATFTLLEAMFPIQCDPKSKALVCQKAEHTFAGMPCGIMDQFISTMGQKDHALLIDCETMESRLVKLSLPGKVILIINSNVKHKLTGSEYPERRRNCAEAAKVLGVKSLRYANMDLLNRHKDSMDDMMYRCARHVIGEIERTEKAAAVLEKGDATAFGQYMNESHNSLRDDYRVSCAELDQLVDLTLPVPGVYGSRMTGGGFGGCTVTLCDKEAVENVIQAIKDGYTGEASFLEVTAADGAQIL